MGPCGSTDFQVHGPGSPFHPNFSTTLPLTPELVFDFFLWQAHPIYLLGGSAGSCMVVAYDELFKLKLELILFLPSNHHFRVQSLLIY